ncbi:MAG: hypothetical protein B7X82_03270 [Hydrogenophilales bacterium 17-64-65]|jgi:hypothetical protein|nr:MAG: hypothetical protein B7Y27_07175 [Hydrogenophilales bacterium 16-64-40]OZA35001.1 MAG: hypothetical protein B7X82_03270 [Hydrogenophilales bacterium 17-64-65]
MVEFFRIGSICAFSAKFQSDRLDPMVFQTISGAEDAAMDMPDVNGRVFFHSVTASSSMRSRR